MRLASPNGIQLERVDLDAIRNAAAQEPLVSVVSLGKGKGAGPGIFAVSRDKLQAILVGDSDLARALRTQYPGQADRQAAALAWIAVHLHAYILPQYA